MDAYPEQAECDSWTGLPLGPLTDEEKTRRRRYGDPPTEEEIEQGRQDAAEYPAEATGSPA